MTEANLYDILICPLYTEKSTMLTEQNKFAFKVSRKATKLCVKKAIEKIFGAKVESVNILLKKEKTALRE